MTASLGAVLRQAREIRELSSVDTARAAKISPAYLSKLENDAVRKPSPHVLRQLSEALTIPYAELMRLTGYLVPSESNAVTGDTIGAALFADLSDDEREELLDYLAWYRTRRRLTGRAVVAG
jgi:transcriptional regulator with XRE-family HTH domain